MEGTRSATQELYGIVPKMTRQEQVLFVLRRPKAFRIFFLQNTQQGIGNWLELDCLTKYPMFLNGRKSTLLWRVIMQIKNETNTFQWHNAKTDPPNKPNIYYCKGPNIKDVLLCEYKGGIWTAGVWGATPHSVEVSFWGECPYFM